MRMPRDRPANPNDWTHLPGRLALCWYHHVLGAPGQAGKSRFFTVIGRAPSVSEGIVSSLADASGSALSVGTMRPVSYNSMTRAFPRGFAEVLVHGQSADRARTA